MQLKNVRKHRETCTKGIPYTIKMNKCAEKTWSSEKNVPMCKATWCREKCIKIAHEQKKVVSVVEYIVVAFNDISSALLL